jgi:hypothetical protein
MDDKRDWILRVLGYAIPESAGDVTGAIRSWQVQRDEVVVQLRKLGRAIRAVKDPEADAAIVLIEAIVKNLTPRPETSAQVTELQRYLTTDQIIDEAELPNGFGLTVAIRAPLLPPLRALGAALAGRPQ